MTVPDHLIDAVREVHELGHGYFVDWSLPPRVLVQKLLDVLREQDEAFYTVWVLAGRPCEYEPAGPERVQQ